MRSTKMIVVLGLVLASCQTTTKEPELRTNLPPISMEKADLNNDGVLDREEFDQRLEVLFELRDGDNDDELAPAELLKVNPEAFDQADRDDSGRLSKEEYLYLRDLDFNRLDTDEDGTLYRQDLFKW